MLTLETALRLIVIGQELLIAAIFLISRGSRAARISGALFVLSVAGYLFASDPVLREAPREVLLLAVFLAIAAPFCLWSFARAIFEAPWPPLWIMAGLISIGLFDWVVFVAEEFIGPAWISGADIAMHITALLVVGHTLWLVARGRPDDLVEKRRRFRLWFVAVIAIEVIAVVVVELIIGRAAPPGWLTMLNVMVIALLTLVLMLPTLRTNPEFFPAEAQAGAIEAPEPDGALGAREKVLKDKLLAAMGDGAYRETGLTISQLAESLDYPEHYVRRLINGHLGFRNFSAFLNSYRVADAQSMLANPDLARTPILTMALDLGYGSIGPFNRAFKVQIGMTPTDYRQQNLGAGSADSE